jgi:hypothetical protein
MTKQKRGRKIDNTMTKQKRGRRIDNTMTKQKRGRKIDNTMTQNIQSKIPACLWLGPRCLTPLSTIFQLYRGSLFSW